MNTFATYKTVAKHLWDSLAKNYKVVKLALANAVRVAAISKTMEVLDPPIVYDCITKHKAF